MGRKKIKIEKITNLRQKMVRKPPSARYVIPRQQAASPDWPKLNF